MSSAPPREQWPRLLGALDELLALTPAERAARLDTLATGEPAFAAELRRMLDSLPGLDAAGFLETLPRPSPQATEPTPAPERLGPWRLVRELGRGGMGVVYLAERADGVVMPPVALKLPFTDPLRAALIGARFERERRIVGALDHPGIAAVRDAGVADGQAWLALEYVDGQPIDTYADERGLSIAERLRLFLQALDAVGYAHSRLVIHRDIKPPNVLVDKAGHVKLLDFGVAKLMQEDGAAPATALTQHGGRALTPLYASPEQIEGGVLSTATDLYSLGVLLYELLAGTLPYGETRPTAAAIEEAVLRAAIVLPSVAAPGPRKRALRGDIDAIVAKALARRPGDRYRSAEAFADDIRRHLESRPVRARPAGLAYRIGKQLRRHALAYGAGAAVAVALAVGVASTVWQARIARIEAQRANAVQRFVLDIFRASSARQSDPQRARETTARELLEIGSVQFERSLAETPEARLEIGRVLAQLHAELGLTEKAAELRRRAVADAERLHGPQSLELVEALTATGGTLHHLGRLDERKAALERALAIVRAGPDRPSRARANLYRKWSELEQSGNLAEAARWADLALADAEKLDDDQERYHSAYTAATARYLARQPDEAEPLYRRALAAADRCRCLFASELIQARVHVGEVQGQLLEVAASEATLRAAMQESIRLNGPTHLDTVQSTLRLVGVLASHGKGQLGLPLIEPVVRLVDSPQGSDDYSGPHVYNVYGNTLNQLQRYDDAAVALQRGIALRDRTRANTPFAAVLRESLARAQLGAGRLAEAQATLAEAERIHRATGTQPGHRIWDRIAATWVMLHLARGDSAAAAQRAAEMAPGIEAGARPSVATLDQALVRAQLALELGRRDTAALLLTRVREVQQQKGLTAEVLPSIEARRQRVCERWSVGAPAAAAPGPC